MMFRIKGGKNCLKTKFVAEMPVLPISHLNNNKLISHRVIYIYIIGSLSDAPIGISTFCRHFGGGCLHKGKSFKMINNAD